MPKTTKKSKADLAEDEVVKLSEAENVKEEEPKEEISSVKEENTEKPVSPKDTDRSSAPSVFGPEKREDREEPEKDAKTRMEEAREAARQAKEEMKAAEKAEKAAKKAEKAAERAEKGADQNNFHLGILTISCVTAICSVFALAFSIYNYQHSSHVIYSGTDGNSANFTEGSIAEVASKVSPSVVSILTETRTMSWFGQSSTSSAAGTGMIISEDGYILTNKHVVEDADDVEIVMDDGTSYTDAKLIGLDPVFDAAIIKINNVSGLPAVTLGDSKTINVGQQVIAIGNALGQYQNTVTEGIVSGTGRSLVATSSDYSSYETLNDMIQTDAAINGGNSGGPLVNAAGQVIGINTAVASANSIGFAIPISSVKGIINSAIKNNKVEHAYIGVNYVNLTADKAKEYNLPVSAGAYVHLENTNSSSSSFRNSNNNNSSNQNPVISGSPADKAGLKDGDIITAVNGYKIGKSGSLSALIGEYSPGDTIQLTVLRDGGEQTINLTLGTYPTSSSSN